MNTKSIPVMAVCTLLGIGVIFLPAQQQTNTGNSLNNVKPACGLTITGPSWIRVNDEDDNKNEHWDWDEEPQGGLLGEDDLNKIVVTCSMPLTCTQTHVIKVDVQADGWDRIDGFWVGEKKVVQTDSNGNQTIQTSGSDADAKIKKSGKSKPYYMFGVNPGESVTVHLWIEGDKHSISPEDVVIQAESTSTHCGVHGKLGPEIHKLTVYQTDLDLDSNNNEGTNFTEGSREEDEIEFSAVPVKYPAPNWSKRPGKLIVTNDGFGDPVPDWADGFDSDPSYNETQSLGPPIKFIPLRLERKPPFTDQCKVKFTYSASDPKQVTTSSGGGFPNVDNYDKQFKLPSGGKILRIWKKNNDGSLRDETDVTFSEGEYVPDAVEIPWDKLSSGAVAELWVEAVNHSSSIGDLQIIAEISENGAKVPDELNMTAIQITCEPITSELQAGLYPYNPAGIVNGETSKFFIDVEPVDFPNAEITWEAVGGSCGGTTSTGGTRRITEFSATMAGDGNIKALIKGNYYAAPHFPIKVFYTWTNVNLNVFIAHDPLNGNPAITVADVNTAVQKTNEVYKQAGIQFNAVFQPWASGNGSDYYNLTYAEVDGMFADTPFSGGLRVIFVYETFEALTDPNGYTNGVNYDGTGLVCRTDVNSGDGLARILAHEIGHACGLEDIYKSKNDLDGGSPSFLQVHENWPAKKDWANNDWPEDGSLHCEPAYYSRFDSGSFNVSTKPDSYATRQVDLIGRALMHGHTDPNNMDIPLGSVFGVTGGYGPGRDLNVEQAEIGINSMDRTPVHAY